MSYSKFLLPVVITIQYVLLLVIFNMLVAPKQVPEVSCDYFVNVTEWRQGSSLSVSPDMTFNTQPGAMRSYEKIKYDYRNLCGECDLHLDSCRIQLLKSASDDTAVEVVSDTLITY